MQEVELVIGMLSAPAVGALIVEGVKWAVKQIKKKPELEFSKAFYVFMLPVSQFVAQPLLVALGVLDESFTFDWAYAQTAAQVLLGSLVSVMIYKGAIKPIGDVGKEE